MIVVPGSIVVVVLFLLAPFYGIYLTIKNARTRRKNKPMTLSKRYPEYENYAKWGL